MTLLDHQGMKNAAIWHWTAPTTSWKSSPLSSSPSPFAVSPSLKSSFPAVLTKATSSSRHGCCHISNNLFRAWF